ncbi:hypothetical protein V8E51_001533, partial [Hyaloscypha variabilis]
MHSFAYRALVAGFLALAWAHGNKQRVLYEAAQKVNYGASLGNDHTSFKWDGSASAVIDLAWQGETSISFRCDSYSLWKKETILDFDDIETSSPLKNITIYKNITFASFKVLNVPLALKAKILDLEDANAATSLPNALLGSRTFSSPSQMTIPRIYVANNCSLPGVHCENDFPHRFEAISMSIKPLGFIEKGESVRMEVNGWRFEGDEVKWYGIGIIFFGPGRV